jgi:RNA polymerase sigma factor (sigma-70 family)
MERFEALYRDHHTRLVGWLHQQINDYATAQDLAQDTYVTLWQSRDTVTEWTKTILYYVARQRLIDHYRKRVVNDPIEEASHVINPDDPFEMLELRWEIKQRLNAMPECERQVILLRMDGYTDEEIRVTLGIALGTVKSRANRVREAAGTTTKQNADAIRDTARRLARQRGRLTSKALAQVAGCSSTLALHHLKQLELDGYLYTCGVEMDITRVNLKAPWVWAPTSKLLRRRTA